ncbi:hypothetical protein UCDDS831_g02902 [Diplodia seriata]|uniref:Uncharacterized protein n=1 Tax=Diplodia seriata TaxID=420778 RepID=A0A0G2ENJ0_9PEZI|nr:hypothetical protein UCDDS831_g02902 [Diplodia seriata]
MNQNSLIPQAGGTPFRWNELPSEVKNMVYDEVLKSNSPVNIISYQDGPNLLLDIRLGRDNNSLERSPDNFYDPDQLCPNILLASKQTYWEGAAILYRNNITFTDPWTFDRFMFRMTERHVPAAIPATPERPAPQQLGGPRDFLKAMTLSPTTSRGEQMLLFRIDAGWRICTQQFRNLRKITLDGIDISNLETDVHTFAAVGGFRQLVDNRGGSNGPALVDSMIEVTERTALLYCEEKHDRIPSPDEGPALRPQAESALRDIMKDGLAETDLPHNNWDT